MSLQYLNYYTKCSNCYNYKTFIVVVHLTIICISCINTLYIYIVDTRYMFVCALRGMMRIVHNDKL